MRVRIVCAAVSALVVTAGCTSSGEPDAESDSRPPAQVGTAAPQQRLTLVPEADQVGAAVGASRVLFETAEVVVLVPEGDDESMLLGASAAVALGVPLLVEPADAQAADGPLADELERLGTATVLAVGTDGGTREGRPEIVEVPVTPAAVEAAVEAAVGVEWQPADPVGEGEEAAAVAGLDPEAPALLQRPGAEADADGDPEVASLPEVERGEPLADTVVLTSGEAETVAGIATARAAGARVLHTGGTTDPRDPQVIEALAEEPAETVVALGPSLTAEEGLDWKLETAVRGHQLPGGGQLLFPGRLFVALYGHPGTAALGVLGEQGVEASVQRAQQVAAQYEPLVETQVVPTFEIIATVASSAPGADGNYSAEAEPEVLRPWVEAAGEAGVYVVLDLQPGRTDFVTQAERYRSLLELPHVGLALDPEWRLGPDQVHLRQIGSVQVDEVNRVVTWLADLTRDKALPQKLLVLHQFKLAMLPGRERVDTSRDELAVLIHADGQGGQGDKQATWRVLRQNPPADVWWGWKNFHDEDAPMLTPEQTVVQVHPTPQFISYQ